MAEDPMERLLYTIGGCEVALLNAMEQKDWDFVKALKAKQKQLHERLRRLAYGLPEESPTPTKD